MKKLYILGLAVSCMLPLVSKAQSWIPKASFTNARFVATSFSIGSKGYVATGYSSSVNNDLWEYDPTSDTWTQKANFGGVARYVSVSFVVNNKGYLATGHNGGTTLLNDMWEYDPSTNTWAQKMGLNTARFGAFGFAVGNKGYVGTGQTNPNSFSQCTNDLWEYDPSTNGWTQKANFPGGTRSRGVAFAIGNKGYAGTGYDGASNYNDFYEYDPASNNWTTKAALPGDARRLAVGFSMNNRGYIGTGYATTHKNDFWEYDPLTNTWLQKINLGGIGRDGGVGLSINGRGYIGLGSNGSGYLSDFWEYNDPLSVKNNYAGYSSTVYPNPVIDNATITIDVNGGMPNGLSFELMDVSGRLVRSSDITCNKFIFEKGELARGVYIYRIIADSKPVSSGKITITQ